MTPIVEIHQYFFRTAVECFQVWEKVTSGDIIGSPYEHRNHRSTDFALFSDRSRFTDDTVLTVAVADVILHGKDYAETLVEYFSG